MTAGLSDDLRYALRGLAHSPGYAAAALTILALAIGANTAVFSIADGLLLRPLPFGPHSERVVTLHGVHPTQEAFWDDLGMSWPDAEDVRRESRTLEGVAGYLGRSLTLGGRGEDAERVRGGSVTPNLFPTLGVEPVLGRGFHDDEAAEPGFEAVAILGHGLWQRRLAGDPDVIGRSIVVNERPLEVVGVMPAGFGFEERDELWLPFRPAAAAARDARWLLCVARLAPGRSLEQAREELSALAQRVAALHPDTNRDWSFTALRFRDSAVSPAARALAITLLAAVALVLLVGCANLAGLLLARAAGRSHELAVRTALGAGRGRLVRQTLVESLLLSLAGGALGALLAAWTVDAVMAAFREPLPYWLRIEVDPRALAFTAVVAVLTGIGFGLVPALRAARVDPSPVLSGSGRSGGTGLHAQRLQSGLVVVQIALSLGLMMGASLLMRSFLRMQSADPGFDTRGVASLRVTLAGDAYDPPEARVAFFREALERLRALPGVTGATATTSIPADDGGWGERVVPEAGRLSERDGIGVQAIAVTGDFFETLGLGLVQGRSFEGAETEVGGPPVAVVSRTLAERLWPGEDPLGKRLALVSTDDREWLTVVGVAPWVQWEEFGEATLQSRSNLYVPYARDGGRTMALMLRAATDPGAALQQARSALRAFAPGLPAWDVSTMEQRRVQTTWGERLFSHLLASFAAMALLLACVGVYGVMAYGARTRTTEIGIRLALGADHRDVLWMLLRRGLRLAGVGLLLGVPVAAATGALLSGALFGVDPFDARAGAALALLLGATVMLASYLPSRRAAGADPAEALREG